MDKKWDDNRTQLKNNPYAHELLKPSSSSNKRALTSWIISRRNIIQGFSHNRFARHWKLSTATATYLFLQLFFNIFVFSGSTSSFKSTLFRIASVNIINFISPFTNFVWFYFKTLAAFLTFVSSAYWTRSVYIIDFSFFSSIRYGLLFLCHSLHFYWKRNVLICSRKIIICVECLHTRPLLCRTKWKRHSMFGMAKTAAIVNFKFVIKSILKA